MSVKNLANGKWMFRFEHAGRAYRGWHFKTKKDAQNAEAIKKSEVIRKNSYNKDIDDNLKLCDAAQMWYEEYSLPHKKTWSTDRAHIRVINICFGAKRIRDISPRDVEQFRQYVAKNVRTKFGTLVKLHTVNHYHATLKAIIFWAKKRRIYFGDNPAWGVPMARVPKARVRFLLPDEEKRLTPAVARMPRLWPYYVIALHTGMRLGEVQAIRVKDVIRHPKPMIFIPHSKTRRSRYVPLYGNAVEVMGQRVKRKEPEAVALEAVSKAQISKWFNDAVRNAQVPDFSFHCLRHTFAAHMLSKGVPIYIVSKMLGHSTVLTTESHYGHLDKDTFAKEIHHIGGVMTMPTLPDVLNDFQLDPSADTNPSNISFDG